MAEEYRESHLGAALDLETGDQMYNCSKKLESTLRPLGRFPSRLRFHFHLLHMLVCRFAKPLQEFVAKDVQLRRILVDVEAGVVRVLEQ